MTIYVPFVSAKASIFTKVLLPCLLATLFLLGSQGAASAASAGEVSTFKVPHEILRSGMLVIDLNGDGKKEIITGSVDGYLTVVNGATYQVVWDKNLGSYLPGFDSTRVQSSLASADLNGDGKVEVVIATGGADPINSGGPGAIIVLTYVGGADYFQLMPNWPVFAQNELGDSAPDGFTSTPALGDIDGDGDMEIVIGGMDRRLHAFHHTGSYVNGWPLSRDYGILRDTRSSAALADLDGNGVLDIIMGTNSYGIPNCANPYLFYAMRGDTTLLPGFPYSTTQNIESSPAIADINNDGSLDIIFGTGEANESCSKPGGFSSDGHKVYALDRFGKPLPNWPVRTNGNTPNSVAVGDLDNDGTPEIVIHTESTLYAWHGDGSLVQGFPVTNGVEVYHKRHATPVLADVDGDSEVEIVLASGQVYGPTGELEQSRNKLQSQVVVTDQDDDGLFETIGANHYNYDKGLHLMVYIFQETGLATGAQPWPMYRRTVDRTGVLPILFTLSGSIVDQSNKGIANVEVALSNGREAVTDAKGKYTFGSLPPGDYTITPAYETHFFRPEQRSLTLASNMTLETMVMHEPVFDIEGRVVHANNSPLAGVTVELEGHGTKKTDGNGNFSFAKQQPGQYTLAPVSPDYTYLPDERSLRAEDEFLQLFYALPKPVVNPLQPNSATELEFNDTQGLVTRVTFPEGLGDDEARITPLLAKEPSGYLFTGHAIDIALSSANFSAQSGVVGQDGELLSLEIQIEYNESDLQGRLDAKELVLMWLSPEGWTHAQATCPSGAAENNLAAQVITVPVCQWGTYALFAPVSSLYIPNVHGIE